MRNDRLPGPEFFTCQQSIFGAVVPETMRLLLVVEAKTADEARARVDSVAPLLGVNRSCSLIVVQMEEMPSGVPTFLEAFFEAGRIGISREDVVPSTNTFH